MPLGGAGVSARGANTGHNARRGLESEEGGADSVAGAESLHVSQQNVSWDPRAEDIATFVQRAIESFKEDQTRRIERDVVTPIQQALTIHQAEEHKRAELDWQTRAEDLQNEYAEEIRKRSVRHTEYVGLLRNRIKELEAAHTPRHTQKQPILPNLMLGRKRQADPSFAEPPLSRTRTDQAHSDFYHDRAVAVSDLGGTDHLFTARHQSSNVTSRAHQIISRESRNHRSELGIRKDHDITDLSATPASSVSERSHQLDAEDRRDQDQSTDFEIEEGKDDESYQNSNKATNEIGSRSESAGHQGHDQSRPQALAADGTSLRRSRRNKDAHLSPSQAEVPAQRSTTSRLPIPPGAMMGLPGLPIKVLALDGTGKYKWRTEDTPKELSEELEKALLRFIGEYERRTRNFRRWLKNPRDCALTFTITTGRSVSIFPQELVACTECTGGRRPCVIILTDDQGEQQLGFLRAHDGLRNGTVDDVAFYMPTRND
ncbi:uncharacterized protein N0V89_003458 [Didymosphaeria variabile]|uniref:Uncharacterized protein n=1 Tax=Didymosphaeria variabile TaxID=1932322 RepID=A0A9W8XNR8_9PLEO|nr:uncharacterized protein N0V89_003458 [Didymosphaeria variabile]KAJ4355442.1 hypothetical protein N0V89_003458 [Didymosphaeria variabile]